MIVHSLTMTHFRQFYGTQTITFAQPSDNQRIVTIVLGENGRGKTGIYRAMMLALFGDFKLSQDSKEANIYLGNIKAVDEKSKEGKGAKCSVTLQFTHRDQKFTITRTYFAMKDESGMQKEQLLEAILTNETTGESWHTEHDIQAIIHPMLDERVKQYFFFDGERIERLTRVSALQKEEVKLGIKNLLRIEQVLKARSVLERMLMNVKKELEKHSTGDYKIALKQMANLEEKIKYFNNKLSAMEEEKKQKEQRMNEIDDSLQSYESVKLNMAERDRLENDVRKIAQQMERNFDEMKEMNKFLPYMLGEDTFHQQITRLSNELTDGLEDGITLSFIETLIEDLRCICGTEFTKDSPEYKQLNSLVSSVKRYEENKQLYDVFNHLKQLIAYIEGREQQAKTLVSNLERLKTEKEEADWRLEEINKLVSNSGEDKIRELNEERKSITNEILQLNNDEQHMKENLSLARDEANKLSLTIEDLQHRSGVHKQLLRKHTIITRAIESISEVIQKFEADLMEELEIATQQNLYYLLDESGQAIIKKVQIQEDYTLEVLNNYGQKFLANISQGQRQVLSLSFITALAQVAGDNDVLEMPLFMDTPFGRLSGKHQENLIEYLPKICSQWVLLLTDQEFTEAERKQFIETGTVGQFYELISEEAGVTKIKQTSIDAS